MPGTRCDARLDASKRRSPNRCQQGGWGRTASEGHATERRRTASEGHATESRRTASEGHATAVVSQLCLGRWRSR